MKSKFQLFQSDKNNEYYFRLLARNSKIILQSEGYKTKQGCLNGIDSVKENAPDDNRYKRLTARNGKYYFNLTAKNNQVIGTSEMYNTIAAREVGIEAVKREAPCAEVEDLTELNDDKKSEAKGISDAEVGGRLKIKPKSGHCSGILVPQTGGSYGGEDIL